MHMADALVSPVVAGVAGAAAAVLIGISSHKVKAIRRDDIVPMMGVMGAFIFAAQMINFTIPGTGSSGHIIGGVLLAALLGPWAAFITLSSVLIIQCLIFADGGLMALGCNILNMGAMSCLVAYPLIYRPIAGKSTKSWRVILASVVACVAGLEFGALLVTAETELSGVTALSSSQFLALMTSIHLAIGLCEGVATGLVIAFVAAYKPDSLYSLQRDTFHVTGTKISRRGRVLIGCLAGAALLMAVAFTWIASENPDGLEWSIAKVTGATELGVASIPSTAFMPDYDSTFAGIVGGVIVMVMLWCICALIFRNRRKAVADR
jgi:cobalt/nickel transport system permease protein